MTNLRNIAGSVGHAHGPLDSDPLQGVVMEVPCHERMLGLERGDDDHCALRDLVIARTTGAAPRHDGGKPRQGDCICRDEEDVYLEHALQAAAREELFAAGTVACVESRCAMVWDLPAGGECGRGGSMYEAAAVERRAACSSAEKCDVQYPPGFSIINS